MSEIKEEIRNVKLVGTKFNSYRDDISGARFLQFQEIENGRLHVIPCEVRFGQEIIKQYTQDKLYDLFFDGIQWVVYPKK